MARQQAWVPPSALAVVPLVDMVPQERRIQSVRVLALAASMQVCACGPKLRRTLRQTLAARLVLQVDSAKQAILIAKIASQASMASPQDR